MPVSSLNALVKYPWLRNTYWAACATVMPWSKLSSMYCLAIATSSFALPVLTLMFSSHSLRIARERLIMSSTVSVWIMRSFEYLSSLISETMRSASMLISDFSVPVTTKQGWLVISLSSVRPRSANLRKLSSDVLAIEPGITTEGPAFFVLDLFFSEGCNLPSFAAESSFASWMKPK